MEAEFAVAALLGRLLDLLRRAPDAEADQKAALKSLLERLSQRSFTIRLEAGGLRVDGVSVPSETPFVAVLMNQLQVHGVAEVHVGHDAPAVDLIHLIEALAPDLLATGGSYQVDERLRELQVASVSIVTAGLAEVSNARRRVRVTDALAQSRGAAPRAAPPDLELVAPSTGAARDSGVRRQAAAGTLSAVIVQLDEAASGPALLKQLDTILAEITKALDQNRVERAIDAIAALVRREREASAEHARQAYGVVLQRVLVERYLSRLAPSLLDGLYAADVIAILRRSGAVGTRALVQHLVSAPTFAERRTYLDALRQLDQGLDIVASMLGHHEWFVVRNMADLAGDLHVEQAVPSLVRAVEHDDPRVRRAAGAALAKIGVPAAGRGLVKVFRDTDREVRLAAVREIRGQGLDGVTMPLVSAAEAEEDPEVEHEFYLALGRIGTRTAVRALTSVATGKTGARRSSDARLAAVEGLALMPGDAARSALTALTKQGGRDVRQAARRALSAS